MRTGIIVAAAWIIGGLAGAVGVQLWQQGKIDGLQTELARALTGEAEVRRQAEEAADKLEAVQRRADSLERQVASLSSQLDEAKDTAHFDRAALTPEGDAAMTAPPDWGALAGDAMPPQPERPDPPTQDEDADAQENADEETQRAEREARRAEWRARIEDRLNTFYDEAYMGAKDRQEQDRVALMKEYTDYTMDLWAQARLAETDEERQALREAGGEAMRTLNDLRREQQTDMVRDVAVQHGITDPQQQDALAQSVIELQQSPFFQPGRLFGGGLGRGRR